jgi:hypothetical protein
MTFTDSGRDAALGYADGELVITRAFDAFRWLALANGGTPRPPRGPDGAARDERPATTRPWARHIARPS